LKGVKGYHNKGQQMAATFNDPLGHGLIEQRLAQIPSLLIKMLEETSITLSSKTLAAQSFIVTGIGSSEAHARYLTLLLNIHTHYQALYIGFTGLMRMTNIFNSDRILVLFSQGLSPNAQMVLKYGQNYFSHVVLFTSMNNEQLTKKCQWIRIDKIETIQFPIYDEYVTLIRVIGPICGFLATILFVQHLTNKKLIEVDYLREICMTKSSSFSLLRNAMIDDYKQQFSRGPFYLILSSPLIDVCQNICYKFVEGVYWTSPIVCDYLQFAHGPFQQIRSVTVRPSAIVCIIDRSNSFDIELECRLRQMIKECNDEQHLINVYTLHLSSSSIIYSIFELEMELNRLIFEIICANGCDQIHWPGKGQDQPLYSFQG
jgi:creatinine amidohydrolase